MMRLITAAVLALTLSIFAEEYITAPAAGPINPPTQEWIAKIEVLAPDTPTAEVTEPRKILVFSLATGFKHKLIPHVKELVRVLGEKSGAFTVEISDDVNAFTKENLARFDAVLLNNTCPCQPKRDLFWDVLEDEDAAAELEANLVEFVKQGGGLIGLHGAAAFQVHSPAVSDMMGGSFAWHPKFQKVTLNLVEPDHPLSAAFDGKGFVHDDEPYIFNHAYTNKNFRPLLEMDVSKLNEETRSNERVTRDVRYVAWIKRHGEGRVFYCSPSHHPASYETEELLQFVLDGIQYALGDLKCDDAPID